MTSVRCKCGVISNYGMTCVRCRQEVYRSRYSPTPKEEPVEPTAPVEETEDEEEQEESD